MRTRIALVLALMLIAFVVPTADAQGCSFPQADMAGRYVGAPALMTADLTSCGAVTIVWQNAYGWHKAYYASVERVPGGGIGAAGFVPDPQVGWLDNSYSILVKPAEPGYVQVFTARGYYRLRKAD